MRVDAPGGLRVERAQLRRERFGALRLRPAAQFPAQGGVFSVRRKAHVRQERVHIQPGAARDDRQAAPRADLRDAAGREPDVIRHAERLRRVPEPHQVVRHTAHLGRRGLRRSDREPAVNLHGVGGDDLAAETERKRDRQPGLSRRGGADDRGDRNLPHHRDLPNRRSSSPRISTKETGLPCGQ